MDIKKREIVKITSDFTKSQNVKILKFLHNKNVKITEARDGVRINMDKLSSHTIDALYYLVKFIQNNIDDIYRIY